MYKNIAITESYLSSVFRLDNQSRKITLNTVKLLASQSKSTSLQIHSIDRIKCDPKFRSARVNSDLRIIFLMQGDTYTLLYVDHHDKAYDWCEGKFLTKTDFGAEYIYDENVSFNGVISEDTFSDFLKVSILENRGIKEKHLIKIGIPEIHAANLIKIFDEDNYMDYITMFPMEIQEALLDLAAGSKTIEEVYIDLTDEEYDEKSNNPFEQKDSRRRFYLTQSLEELEFLMANDEFEKWTIFLHPSQERIVRRNYNGPVLVEGGPGTGKTIVGIHRAVYLAESVYKEQDDKRILFVTFSKKLAKIISGKIDLLTRQRNIANNIHVIGVDSFIFSQLKKNEIAVPNVNLPEFSKMFSELYDEHAPPGTKAFYEFEYFEVIEKFNIKSLSEYLNADRSGTGFAMDKSKRETAWRFLSKIVEEKENRNLFTFVDRARLLFDSFEFGNAVKSYDSIIIDEAQDLETVKIKALVNCVRTDKNNVMILSDMNQRIFRLSTWKNDSGINVVGRTYYLSVNYRTTKEIKDYASHQFMNSDITTVYLKDYKSIISGVLPEVAGFENESEQYKFVVNKVNIILSQGYLPHQIGIVCPTRNDCNKIQSILTFSEINSIVLIDDLVPDPKSGVCICPVNGVKGLEFEAVVIFNYNSIGQNRVRGIDTPALKVNYQKLIECEKYVASTRARDLLVITYLESEDNV